MTCSCGELGAEGRSLVPTFTKELRDLLFGNPFGEVFPPRENPAPPVADGRTTALRILKKYFQELVFYRDGGKDASGMKLPPIAFKLPERDIHIEWPDDPENVHLPSVAFLSEDRADYDSIGLTGYVDESSRDVHAPGTILVWMCEYQEKFVVEVWAETKAQRRAILSGLEIAFFPLQQMAGIRFQMPEYFGQLVCFQLQDRETVEDDLAIRNRRRSRLRVEMRFNVVALVNAVDFDPTIAVADEPPGADDPNVEVTAAGGATDE